MKERGDLFSLSLSSAYRALVPDGPVLRATASQYINQDVDGVTHPSYHTTTTSRWSASPPVPKRTLSWGGGECCGLLIKCRVRAAFYPNDRSTGLQGQAHTLTDTLLNHLTLTCLLHSFIQVQLLGQKRGNSSVQFGP